VAKGVKTEAGRVGKKHCRGGGGLGGECDAGVQICFVVSGGGQTGGVSAGGRLGGGGGLNSTAGQKKKQLKWGGPREKGADVGPGRRAVVSVVNCRAACEQGEEFALKDAETLGRGGIQRIRSIVDEAEGGGNKEAWGNGKGCRGWRKKSPKEMKTDGRLT